MRRPDVVWSPAGNGVSSENHLVPIHIAVYERALSNDKPCKHSECGILFIIIRATDNSAYVIIYVHFLNISSVLCYALLFCTHMSSKQYYRYFISFHDLLGII